MLLRNITAEYAIFGNDKKTSSNHSLLPYALDFIQFWMYGTVIFVCGTCLSGEVWKVIKQYYITGNVKLLYILLLTWAYQRGCVSLSRFNQNSSLLSPTHVLQVTMLWGSGNERSYGHSTCLLNKSYLLSVGVSWLCFLKWRHATYQLKSCGYDWGTSMKFTYDDVHIET